MKFYTNILKKAWQTVWQHKFLWFFGLFAAFVSQTKEYDLYFKNLQLILKQENLLNLPAWLLKFSQLELNVPLILLALLALLFFIYFIAVSQGALVAAAWKYENKRSANFSLALKDGHQHFALVTILNIFNKLIIYFPFFLLLLFYKSSLSYILTSFILLIPLAIFVSFLTTYSINYVVIAKQGLFKAIALAWKLFIANWLVTIEMSLVLFFLSLIVGAGVILAGIVLVAPFLIITLPNWNILPSLDNFLQFAYLGFYLVSFLTIIVGAIFTAFQWTSWTFLFFELTSGKKEAKLLRYIKGK